MKIKLLEPVNLEIPTSSGFQIFELPKYSIQEATIENGAAWVKVGTANGGNPIFARVELYEILPPKAEFGIFRDKTAWEVSKKAIAALPDPTTDPADFIEVPVRTKHEISIEEQPINVEFVIIKFQKVIVGGEAVWVQISFGDYTFLHSVKIL